MAVQDVAETARRLLHVPLFEGLSLDTLAQIVSLSYPKQANAGDFFFNEGDQADEFFVLTAGRVKLTQIIDGTGPLANLHGKGTFTSSLVSGHSDDPPTIVFRSTWNGVADFDAQPPTVVLKAAVDVLCPVEVRSPVPVA